MNLEDAKAVVEANLSSFGSAGLRAVNDTAVVSDLRRAGMDASDAKRLGREAVVEMGGYVERGTETGGLRAGNPRRRSREVWWIAEAHISRGRARRAA